jgi:hypothetical protein
VSVASGLMVNIDECVFDRTVWGGPSHWREQWTSLAFSGQIQVCDAWPTGSEFTVGWWNWPDGPWFPGSTEYGAPNYMVAQESFHGRVHAGAAMYVNGGGPPRLIDPENAPWDSPPDWYCPYGTTTFYLYRNGSVIASASNNAPGAYPGAPPNPGIGNTLLWIPAWVGDVSVGDVFHVTCVTAAVPDPPRFASGVALSASRMELV